jgi:hypothetical protein
MASEVDISELQTVYLFRTGVQFSAKNSADSKSAMGERGIMVVGNVSLQTIERRGGYWVLPKGLFLCSMYETPKIGKAFYIQATGEYGHNCKLKSGGAVEFMIHAANYPYQIEGCVAPGKTILENGVNQSKAAMQEIFTYCGGWGVGKKMLLDVDSL